MDAQGSEHSSEGKELVGDNIRPGGDWLHPHQRLHFASFLHIDNLVTVFFFCLEKTLDINNADDRFSNL